VNDLHRCCTREQWISADWRIQWGGSTLPTHLSWLVLVPYGEIDHGCRGRNHYGTSILDLARYLVDAYLRVPATGFERWGRARVHPLVMRSAPWVAQHWLRPVPLGDTVIPRGVLLDWLQEAWSIGPQPTRRVFRL
jgi:hypothetical protein